MAFLQCNKQYVSAQICYPSINREAWKVTPHWKLLGFSSVDSYMAQSLRSGVDALFWSIALSKVLIITRTVSLSQPRNQCLRKHLLGPDTYSSQLSGVINTWSLY